MTVPGIGPLAASAVEASVGNGQQFTNGRFSTGGKTTLLGISKQGNRLLRVLLVEAANIAARFVPVFRKEYLHRCHQKHFTVVKVASARSAIRMYWMLRTRTPYPDVPSSRAASNVFWSAKARP